MVSRTVLKPFNHPPLQRNPRHGTHTPHMRASWLVFSVSAAAVAASAPAPQSISLAFGRDGFSQMNATWLTARTDASASYKPVVLFGTDPNNLSGRGTGSSTRYDFSSKGFGVQSSPDIHVATMSGLEPSTTYYYSVGDEATKSMSDVRSFVTLPRPGSSAESFVSRRRAAGAADVQDDSFAFAVIGDLGQTNDSVLTATQIAEDGGVDAVLHAGDMSYADTDQTRWDSYSAAMEPLSSRVPWMVGPGNHEIESDNATGASFTPYEHRFNMPAIAPAVIAPTPSQKGCAHFADPDCTPSAFWTTYDYGQSFYSFDAGPAHVVVLNPYTDSNLTSPQGRWLQADLAQHNAGGADRPSWLIVMMHCPWYNSNTHHFEEFQAVDMKKALEQTFLDAGVDVVLAGHVHAYERTLPVDKDVPDASGITYLVIGAGGNREGHAGPFNDTRPVWSAFRNDTQFGHGRLTFHNASHLSWVWYSNEQGQKVPFDRTWIVRRGGGPGVHKRHTVHFAKHD